MPGFESNSHGVPGQVSWTSNPDDDFAHRTILHWLQNAITNGYLNSSEPLSNATKGNIGEFVVYKIGESYVFTNGPIAFTANAHDPLSQISRPDFDIIWLSFGDNATEDWAAIQEVKTTGESSLSLANELVSDYQKLFGENLHLTLQTRLGSLKNKMEQQGQGHLSSRITALGAPTPETAQRIRILPTLVHDSAYDSSVKMVSVRQMLIGKGWSSGVIECWSVALSNLDDRLSRIARGHL